MGAVIILLGPPGVGKGTQASRLKALLGADHISTGDLLREARRSSTDVGRAAARFMDAGELVPDAIILRLVRDCLEAAVAIPVVFDGFPRTLAQADGLEETLRVCSRTLDLVALLEADDELILDRLSGRRSCPGCGTVFHVVVHPPRSAGVCDECGSTLETRPDDRPGTVRNRLEVYRRQTEPLVDFYEHHPVGVVRIDASVAVDDVAESLRSVAERVMTGRRDRKGLPGHAAGRSDRVA